MENALENQSGNLGHLVKREESVPWEGGNASGNASGKYREREKLNLEVCWWKWRTVIRPVVRFSFSFDIL